MHRAFIRNGKIAFAKGMAERFEKWKHGNEGAEIIIGLYRPKRSSNQHRYYWFYLGVIAAETGDNADDLHEFFKRKLLPPVFKIIRGEEVRLPASTTELDKAQFGEYLEKICAMTQVPLPDPEAAGYINEHAPRKRPAIEYPSEEGNIPTQF